VRCPAQLAGHAVSAEDSGHYSAIRLTSCW